MFLRRLLNFSYSIKYGIKSEYFQDIQEKLTSRTETIIYFECRGWFDYDSLKHLDEEELKKLVLSSIPGSRLRKYAINIGLEKELKEINNGSSKVNHIFFKYEQLVSNDRKLKKYLKLKRWKRLNLPI